MTNPVAPTANGRPLARTGPTVRPPSTRLNPDAGGRLGVPWSDLSPSRRDPPGEDLVELGLLGWLARELVVPTPASDPVEDHREVASPQIAEGSGAKQ